jgi:hypothetical protein
MIQTESRSESAGIARALRLARFDRSPSHRQPNSIAVIAATGVSIVVALLVDWLIAKAAVAAYPALKGYSHFAFRDYSKLTVIGIIVACAAWPIVTRICSAPRWLFLRLAVLVSAVLLFPDLAIWVKGQPGKAVAFLVLMHIAIGLITYNALVRIAPIRKAD